MIFSNLSNDIRLELTGDGVVELEVDYLELNTNVLDSILSDTTHNITYDYLGVDNDMKESVEINRLTDEYLINDRQYNGNDIITSDIIGLFLERLSENKGQYKMCNNTHLILMFRIE